MKLTPSHKTSPSGRLRARGAGVPFLGTPGEHNSITDVGPVEVGYCTLIEGEGPRVVGKGPIRTGVTAIFPQGRAKPAAGAYAGYFNMSGNGEMSGMAFVEERGRFDGPITLTNTHSCGIARDVTAKWLFENMKEGEKNDQPFFLPVSAETCDIRLSDMNGHHIKAEHVVAAFEDARSGPIKEGSVGGGTGMRSYEFKAGSGTSSRLVEYEGKTYTVGAFVQSNFGKRHLFHLAGIPVGLEIPVGAEAADETGSIIGIVATDAPMLPHHLRRIARRAAFGIARSGGIASNESGDLFLAFSTANQEALMHHIGVSRPESLGEHGMSPFYEATIQAVDEAIINSIFGAETMTGADGYTSPGLPVERIQRILRRHSRLVEID
ncbi:Beta-peptidyl aminopeptidase BapA [Alphaproteobacteria bacterium SO-S41]|nr:Beta-peptidyl aminopeptidase BapA [Alphaproteobacteria bacterium SO-S41]